MNELNSKQRLITHIAFAVGSVGAIGVGLLLWHTLHNCYPFKAMSFPSGDFFERVANIGLLLAPVLSIGLVKLIKPVRVWLLPVLPVLVCPVLFWALFEVSCAWYKWQESRGAFVVGRNFDDNTLETIKPEFGERVLQLSVEGLCVGLLCGLVLQLLFVAYRGKKLV
jgi:hypothetical protein